MSVSYKYFYDFFMKNTFETAEKAVEKMRKELFSHFIPTPHVDLSDFSICILGYSQNRLISFNYIQNENVSLQFLIRRPKLNHIPHIKLFEIQAYKLTADFLHFVGCKTKF